MTFLPSRKKVIVVNFEELYVQEVCAAQGKHYNGLIQSLIFLPENSGEGLCSSICKHFAVWEYITLKGLVAWNGELVRTHTI